MNARTSMFKENSLTSRDQLLKAISAWIKGLDRQPGWREWKRAHLRHTLYFDDPIYSSLKAPAQEFRFPDEIEKQHAVVLAYLALAESVSLIKECEFYFRRFPFRGLPVSRHSHFSNACEMFFNRFYELRERIKGYFKCMKEVEQLDPTAVGQFIKIFDREFDRELRARHGVHHGARFVDVAIDRLMVVGLSAGAFSKKEEAAHYRKLSREWAERVRRRGAKTDEFLESLAKFTLAVCKFLPEGDQPEIKDRRKRWRTSHSGKVK